MAKKYNEILAEQTNALEKQKAASKAETEKLYTTANKAVTDKYTKQISTVNSDYEDAYRENAVQQKINEFYIAEEMANMGLTASGTEHTQSHAGRLSYTNRKAQLNRQRQSAVNSLTKEMNSLINENKTAKNTALKETDDYYAQLAANNATNIYNSQLQAEKEKYIAEQQRLATATAAKAAKKTNTAKKKTSYVIAQNEATLSKSMLGSFGDNGVTVKEMYDSNGRLKGYTYVDKNSGKSSYFDLGVNPFTGTKNKDVRYGASSLNGYQPNNVNGKKIKTVKGAKIMVNGNVQSVWTENGNYYYWDGRQNKYIKLTAAEKKQLGIK